MGTRYYCECSRSLPVEDCPISGRGMLEARRKERHASDNCSLGCYKRHKDICTPLEQSAPNHSEAKDYINTEQWNIEDLLNEEDITDKVPLERLQLLGVSKELRDLLCNPHLRQLLCSVDTADNKYDAMKAAMQEPLFVEFSDQCLKVVEREENTLISNEDDAF
ncbi:zinc finger HIT domain-containing protein 3 isoform X2 [Antennarius striatus]|uniref:zinc finger HIT domain-containing protein 3 isoform X2 n=1 Tax=Antennarius striatus TaxID=241820 RepID=UPI0035B46C33